MDKGEAELRSENALRFEIQGERVGPGESCLIVGDVAQAHDGSLGMAHAFIDAIANAGADAVKFQTHIARGTIAALFNPQSEIRNTKYEIINLGSDRPVVLMDAIRLVEELVGKKANIEYKPRHPADVLATWADTGKAGQILGWQPQVVLQDGLVRLHEWYQANQDWARDIKTT
jgi:nucleoside-diphosphate-sugar epimerase